MTAQRTSATPRPRLCAAERSGYRHSVGAFRPAILNRVSETADRAVTAKFLSNPSQINLIPATISPDAVLDPSASANVTSWADGDGNGRTSSIQTSLAAPPYAA